MTTDKQMDGLISSWMEETAPTRLPERALDATFARTRASRQQVRWQGRAERFRTGRIVLVLAAVLVVVAAIAVGAGVERLAVTRLPVTPDAWERISIDAGPGSDGIIALAVGPDGLLAVVGDGDGGARLITSTDGHAWTAVPAERLPASLVGGPFRSLAARTGATVVGSDQGFLIVGDGTWVSHDGITWRSLADPADDPGLQASEILAVARGGPGYVAVGSDNQAWFSVDGSDWSRAQVPPPPDTFFDRQGFGRPTVAMHTIAVSGDTLVASGTASFHTEDSGLTVPVLWTSRDGRTWTSVLDPADGDEEGPVAAGPGGFVAVRYSHDRARGAGDVVVHASPDGIDWEPVDRLGSSFSQGDGGSIQLDVSSIAASSAGFVAVGARGPACLMAGVPCEPDEAMIWTSPDGRAWTRLQSDELFANAAADRVAVWGSRFVVAGAAGGHPVIWISGDPTASR